MYGTKNKNDVLDGTAITKMAMARALGVAEVRERKSNAVYGIVSKNAKNSSGIN